MCNCSDICILIKGKETVVGVGAPAVARQVDRNNKKGIFKKFAPLADRITEIGSAQVGNANYLDVDI